VSEENLRRFLSVVAKFFDGFTCTDALGYWEGVRERTFVLEVCAPSLKGVPVKQATHQITVLA
jgi:hypothetical protein